LEHSGGGGGSKAAPLVRQVMETYFKPQHLNKNQKQNQKQK
jgi:penicillin-binding protein 2